MTPGGSGGQTNTAAATPAARRTGTIATVVVTYNRKELLRECLRAITEQTRPPDHVLVVDNGGSDGTGAMIAEEFPQVECRRLYPNVGSAGGFHEALRLAHAGGWDWVWLMDDDCVPAANALEALMRHAAAGTGVVAYGSVMLARGSSHRLAFPTAIFVDGGRQLRTSLRDFPPSKLVPTDSIGFNGLFLPRDIISAVGYPRKDFYFWWDDVEYGMRIARDHGFEMKYVTDSVVHHPAAGYRRFRLPGLTGYYMRASAWKQYYGVRNHLLLDRKYIRPWRFWLVILPRRVLFLHLGILLWERGRLRALWYTWRGLLDGLRGKTGRRVQPT